MKNSYLELLKDPRWQKKRLKIMERDDFTCKICEDASSPLNVHHKKYIKGKMPWEYEDSDLITVCENCHSQITQIKKERNLNIFLYPILSCKSRDTENCLLFISHPIKNLSVIRIYKNQKEWEFLFTITYDFTIDLIKLMNNEKDIVSKT